MATYEQILARQLRARLAAAGGTPSYVDGGGVATADNPSGYRVQDPSIVDPVRDRLKAVGLNDQSIRDLNAMHEQAKAAAGQSDAQLRNARLSGDREAIAAADANHRQNLKYLNNLSSQVRPSTFNQTDEQRAQKTLSLQTQFAQNSGNMRGDYSTGAIDANRAAQDYDPAQTARAFFSRPLVGDGVSGIQGGNSREALNAQIAQIERANIARSQEANRAKAAYQPAKQFQGLTDEELMAFEQRKAERDRNLRDLETPMAQYRTNLEAAKAVQNNNLGNVVRNSETEAMASKVALAEQQRALVDAQQKTAVATTGVDAETNAMKEAKLASIRKAELATRAAASQENVAAINSNPTIQTTMAKIVNGLKIVGAGGELSSRDPAMRGVLGDLTDAINEFDALPQDIRLAAAQDLMLKLTEQGIRPRGSLGDESPISQFLKNLVQSTPGVIAGEGLSAFNPSDSAQLTDSARAMSGAFQRKLQLLAAKSARQNTQ